MARCAVCWLVGQGGVDAVGVGSHHLDIGFPIGAGLSQRAGIEADDLDVGAGLGRDQVGELGRGRGLGEDRADAFAL